MTDKPTTRRQYSRRNVLKRGGLYVGTVTAGSSFATATSVSADTNSLEGGVLADGFDGGDRWAFLSGYLHSSYDRAGRMPTVETLADRLRNEFNANADLWISYGDWLLEEQDVIVLGDATIAVDVIETTVLGDDDVVETALEVRFDDANETFTALEWLDESADDPDYRIGLADYAAHNAPDELQEYRREFIGTDTDDHELPDEEYLSELAGKYWDRVRLGDQEQSVLELLLGEVRT